MKRPLFLVCIALTVMLVLTGNAGNSIADSPAFYGEAILTKAAEQTQIITLKGCVASCSTVSEGRRLSVFQLSVLNGDRIEFSLLSELKLNLTTEDMTIKPGDHIVFSGEYVPYQEARNPGNFDAESYYRRENIIGKIKNPQIHSVTEGKMGLQRILYTVRESLRKSCEQILEERKGRTLSAICLGEKSNMEQAWKDVYQEGGISHILAVSGLHITMIGMTVFGILRRICVPYAGSALLSGAVSLLYVMMTGCSVSAVRALLMFGIWLGAQVCGRKYDMRTAMAIAALLLVISDPECAATASFCLSFGAVAVIAILLPCVQKTCEIRNKLAVSVTGSVVIFLGTLPITLYFFYQAAPWSVLVNIAAVGLMPSLMGMGLLSSAAGIFAEQAGIFLASSVAWLLAILELLCRIEQRLPMTVWVTGQPSIPGIVLYYALLFVTGIAATKWMKRRDAKRCIGRRLIWIMAFVIGIGLMCRRADENLRITCLDVGQGDCSLIQFPDGTDCLIDGGSSSVKSVWEYRIGDTIKYYGADTLEYVFLSHADSDHTSGILEFLQEYTCGWDGRNTHGVTIQNLILPPTADPEDFAEITFLASENGITVLQMEQGDEIAAENWSITCLAPEKEQLTGDTNQDSMVLMLEYQKFRMLFTGDLEGAAEQALVDAADNTAASDQKTVVNADGAAVGRTDLDADVLKVGHHGSKNASSEAFLEAVSPQIAVISYGEDNSYGHPSEEAVKCLEAAGACIWETAKGGAIQIETDGVRFSVAETCEGN